MDVLIDACLNDHNDLQRYNALMKFKPIIPDMFKQLFVARPDMMESGLAYMNLKFPRYMGYGIGWYCSRVFWAAVDFGYVSDSQINKEPIWDSSDAATRSMIMNAPELSHIHSKVVIRWRRNRHDEKYSDNNWQLFRERRRASDFQSDIGLIISRDDIDSFRIDFAEPSFKSDMLVETNKSIIGFAIAWGAMEIFRFLLINNVVAKDAMYWAIASGRDEMIEVLEQEGMKLEGKPAAVFMQHRLLEWMLETGRITVTPDIRGIADQRNDAKTLALCKRFQNRKG